MVKEVFWTIWVFVCTIFGMNNSFLYPKVTAVTIMYGDRWQFLSQVVDAAMKDEHITKLIIVDNGAAVPGQIQSGVVQYGDRVEVIVTGKNLGSAGGFAKGIERARDTDCDFVLLLDDDSVPGKNIIQEFMDVLKFFPNQKVVLCANRNDVLDNREFFYRQTLVDDTPKKTFFEVFSIAKVKHFLDLLLVKKKKTKRGPFVPIIPTEGFVYGGTLLPIDAVRNAELPDASLFLYGDDVEYSWKIKELGYKSYLCSIPGLKDVDMTFGAESSHIFGQFDKSTSPFKVYYRMRNMVRISRKHSKQGPVILFLNVFVWVCGLLILGLIRKGPTKLYFSRAALMIKAVYAGYHPDAQSVKHLEASFFKG